MPLAEYLADLDQLCREAQTAFDSAGDVAALEAARIEFLGMKSGRIKAAQKGLGTIDKADKPKAGQRFNEVKQHLEAALEAAKQRHVMLAGSGSFVLSGTAATLAIQRRVFDPTVPGIRPRLGHLHPLTQTIEELKDLMGRLGFSVADGPEVEDEWHNFEALNIPAEHPARNPLDNFYLTMAAKLGAGSGASVGNGLRAVPSSSGAQKQGTARSPFPTGPLLLRSQTSTVQIRVMEKTPPPVRIISLGRVYRPDDADATHYPMFHQIEGLLVDRGVTMADLKSVLRLFAKSFFQDDVHIRFRPSFFPFPSPIGKAD